MKTILLSFTFLCAISIARAQDYTLELGVEGGPNASNVYNDPTTGLYEKAYNYYLGITGQYDISDVFSVKSGIAYEQKGFVQTYYAAVSPSVYANETKATNLDYIIIPMLAKISFGYNTKILVDGGPYIGILTKAKGSVANTDTSGYAHPTIENVKNQYKPIDMGIAMGGGVEIPVSDKFTVSIEARFNFGFINISNIKSYISIGESAELLVGVRYAVY